MSARVWLAALLLAALPALAPAQETIPVMVIGTVHMSNPGRDLHDVSVDNVLSPKRQVEIAAVVAGLARFHPTQVDVEWPADLVAKRYAAFLKGKLPPSRNEVVQLGFRLARASHAASYGMDVEGEFPYDAVQAYAKAHGEDALLAAADAQIVNEVAEEQNLLKTGSIAGLLRRLNDPDRARTATAYYHTMLKIGGDDLQPGVDLLTAWYKRNFRICANVVQRARPGDRVVVIFGEGHEFLLRQCVSETPGFELVEPNRFLPR